MSDNQRIYPTHIYDETRRQIAVEVVQKELDKQFPGAKHDSKQWLESKDQHTFWNAVEGLMGGTLLKPLVRLLTAENYGWSKTSLVLDDIRLSSKLSQLERLPDLSPDRLDISIIREKLAANPDEAAEQLRIVETYSKNQSQNNYPVIAGQKDEKTIVLDGNRRVLRALLMGKNEIEAWFAKTNGEAPKNFWVPIDDMMRLVSIYKQGQADNPELKSAVKTVLAEIFAQSEVARIAYQKRIVEFDTPAANELIE